MRKAPRDVLKGGLLTGRQVALDEQIPMLKEIGDLLLEPLALLAQFAVRTARPPAGQFRFFGGQGLTHTGHGSQDSSVQVGQDVKFTDLMGYGAKHRHDGGGIERGSIGRDAPQAQLSRR
jgi:hypothetical protein